MDDYSAREKGDRIKMKRGSLKINVGGTLYETTRSTIESKPESLVYMLLSHHTDGETLFIDRDGPMFRWILYWYREGVVVGVTVDIWNTELAFYSVTLEESVGPKGFSEKEEKARLGRYKAYEGIAGNKLCQERMQKARSFGNKSCFLNRVKNYES